MDLKIGGIQSSRWLDRRWSDWGSLDAALERGNGPSHRSGVYRIRDSRDLRRLLYVGESGDVRKRLFQLRNAMRKADRVEKQGPPHWAGASILYCQRQGAIVEVSWLLDPIDDEGERKGVECECVAAHRWLLKANPSCQFVALDRRGGHIS